MQVNESREYFKDNKMVLNFICLIFAKEVWILIMKEVNCKLILKIID